MNESDPHPTEWIHRIAYIGMCKHIDLANRDCYFAQLGYLLEPGGLLIDHSITAVGVQINPQEEWTWV